MKTSLLVLSILMASTNAIDIQTVPAAKPVEAKAAPHVAVKAPVEATAPKVDDHKVDSPSHHVIAKGHIDLKKAAAVKAPSPIDAKTDDKVAVVKTDHKAAAAHHHVCDTPSCKAARAVKKSKIGEDVKPPTADEHHDKPKMVVVHKAESKTEKPDVHTIKTRPAAKHTDPTTKAH